MYADKITPSMRAAIDETERRRAKQQKYNDEHGIVPKTIVKGVRDIIEISGDKSTAKFDSGVKMTRKERDEAIAKLEKQMKEAAKMLEFEVAAALRDKIIKLRGEGQ